MAILWMDGFDSYGNLSNVRKRYDFEHLSNTYWSYSPTGGRFGAGALVFANFNGYTVSKALPGVTSLTLSFAYKSGSSHDNFDDAVSFGNSSGQTQLLVFESNGSVLRIKRGATILGQFNIVPEQFNWISAKITFDNSAGSALVECNGVEVVNLSSIDTINSGDSSCLAVAFSGHDEFNVYLDDVFICDLTGAAPFNDILPDTRIDTIKPSADGDISGFTPFGTGSNQYDRVNEIPEDGDTSYVESGITGTKDLYQMDDVPVAVTTDAKAVNVLISGENPDGGGNQIKAKIKNGAVEGTGSPKPLVSGYSVVDTVFTQNPDTLADWTPAEINSMQVGIEVD